MVRGDISEGFQEVVLSIDGGRCCALVKTQHGDDVAHEFQATTSAVHHLS